MTTQPQTPQALTQRERIEVSALHPTLTLLSREEEAATLRKFLLRYEATVAALESRCADLEAENAALIETLREFTDDEPCRFDHHGYCQEHGWLAPGECHVARAKRLTSS